MTALSTVTQAIELQQLRGPARADLNFWLARLEPELARGKQGRTERLQAIARATETPYPTVRRKFYQLQNGGPLGLVDKCLAGARWWKTAPESVTLPLADRALVKLYCERNDRSNRAAVKQLRLDWKRGKVATTQPIDERTGYPRGWSLSNLLAHAPDSFELAAVRKGTSAAAAHQRLVYTTRAGLHVGAVYMFDDMWHNVFVNSLGEGQSGRPLELFSHDLFSGRKVRWGYRVRVRKDDGTYRGLTGMMARYIIAATLYLDGYSPRGTTLVGEHGTATWSEAVARAVYEHSDKRITSEFSGMQGAKAHAGQYPGLRRGNPRFKASLESSNNLTQNVFGALPGQTGRNRDDRPEHLPALLDHNEELLALHRRLSPASQALLQFPLLSTVEFEQVAWDLYGQIENDPEHDLEGWIAANNVTQELLLAGQWVDREKLLGASEAEQALALSLIEQGALKTRPRKLTRREVWDRGAAELQRITGAGVVAILGEDLARPEPEKVAKGMIEFEDAEVGPGIHRYEAVIFDPYGARQRLEEGEKYRVFVNPFAPQRLFVCDASLAYLGEAKRIEAPCRGNIEAVKRVMGAVAAERAERLAGVRERHAGAAVEMEERIDLAGRLAAGVPVTEGQHEAAAVARDAEAEVQAARRAAEEARAARARDLMSAD